MLVDVNPSSFGVTIEPVSDRIASKIRAHLRSEGQLPDASVFMQGDEADAFIDSLSSEHADTVRDGWIVRVRMDSLEYLTMVGFDADALRV